MPGFLVMERRFRGGRATAFVVPTLVLWLFASRLSGVSSQPAQGEERVTPADATALDPLPERLSQTGLFAAGRPDLIDARCLPFVPQYPLWSDGAQKRRWLRLPEGSAIDARDPDAWQMPIGARVWKELSFGQRVETRF